MQLSNAPHRTDERSFPIAVQGRIRTRPELRGASVHRSVWAEVHRFVSGRAAASGRRGLSAALNIPANYNDIRIARETGPADTRRRHHPFTQPRVLACIASMVHSTCCIYTNVRCRPSPCCRFLSTRSFAASVLFPRRAGFSARPEGHADNSASTDLANDRRRDLTPSGCSIVQRPQTCHPSAPSDSIRVSLTLLLPVLSACCILFYRTALIQAILGH